MSVFRRITHLYVRALHVCFYYACEEQSPLTVDPPQLTNLPTNQLMQEISAMRAMGVHTHVSRYIQHVDPATYNLRGAALPVILSTHPIDSITTGAKITIAVWFTFVQLLRSWLTAIACMTIFYTRVLLGKRLLVPTFDKCLMAYTGVIRYVASSFFSSSRFLFQIHPTSPV